jgi:hypothetical protein
MFTFISGGDQRTICQTHIGGLNLNSSSLRAPNTTIFEVLLIYDDAILLDQNQKYVIQNSRNQSG